MKSGERQFQFICEIHAWYIMSGFQMLYRQNMQDCSDSHVQILW